MHVAISGGSGHLGAALVRQLLEEGHTVRALVNNDQRALLGLPVEIVQGNLSDPEALKKLCAGAEMVQHLAGQISIGEVPEQKVWEINVNGTQRVINACLATGVSRLIYFSSAHAFSPVPPSRVFDESAPPAHAYPYERSKAAAQALVLEANGQYGLETICLNPTSVLGPWDFKPSLQGKMLLDLYRGKLPLLPPGGYDWVDNRDVARAAAAAMTLGRPGQAYLLSGRYASILEIAGLFGQITGRPAPKRVAPFWLLKTLVPFIKIWSDWSGQPPLFTREALSHVETGHPRVSHLKAAQDLAFQPRPLEETLKDTWKWLHAALKQG